jgi:hypothetical protein
VFFNSHESRTAFIGLEHPQGGEILKLTIRPTTPINVFKGCFLCAYVVALTVLLGVAAVSCV